MSKRIIIPLLILCIVMTCRPGPVGADEVPAKITLKNKQQREVVILGRAGSQYLRMRMIDTPGEIRNAPGEIAFLEFNLPLEKLEIDRRYGENKFREVAALLSKVLTPVFPYLDIPNNATDQVMILIDSLYWIEEYKQAEKVAEQLQKSATDLDVILTAQLYQVLCLLAQEEQEELDPIWKELTPPAEFNELSALYWYTKTRLELDAGKLEPAQISAANLVSFHTKDFKWMPAGLYYAAVGYGKTHRYTSANHAIRNLQMGYPNSLFRSKSVDLYEQLEKDEQAYDAELAREEAEARAEEERRAAKKEARRQNYLNKKKNREPLPVEQE